MVGVDDNACMIVLEVVSGCRVVWAARLFGCGFGVV